LLCSPILFEVNMLNSLRVFFAVLFLFAFTGVSQGQENSLLPLKKLLQPSVVSVASYDRDGNVLISGAGFIISERGHILTLKALIPAETTHTDIKTSDNIMYRVSQVVEDKAETNLVRLALENAPANFRPIPSATFASQIGDRVLVITNNVTTGQTAIEGVVTSAKILNKDNTFRVIASLPENSSGSPVINHKGEVVGVVISVEDGNQNFTASKLSGTSLYPRGARFQPTGNITEDSPGGVRKLGDNVLIGTATKRVAPAYPLIAKRKRVEGTIVVVVTVDENGDVVAAKPLSTNLRCLLANQEEVPPDAEEALKQAAIDSIFEWKFVPTTVKGKPTKVIGTITLNFHL
jgi:hypothetical protein